MTATTAAVSSAIAIDLPPRPADTLFDAALNAWLAARLSARQSAFLVTSGHSCWLYHEDDLALRPVDPDDGALTLLGDLVKAKLLKQVSVPATEMLGITQAPKKWIQSASDLSLSGLRSWEKSRNELFDEGRGKKLSDKAIQQIWHDAGGRCMFEGCGKDLGRTSLSTRLSRIAYLAHIVAADKDGPRGDPALSLALSDAPENIMLMCDEHHRYIDRIAVDQFPATRLNAMRSAHVRFVEGQLNALAYPRTQGVALFSNIANIPTAASDRDMQDAMLDMRLCPLTAIEYPLSGFHRDDRLSPDFWRHLLHQHELSITGLVRQFNGTHPTQERFASLSVFPLTAVPLLFLGGRIVGEGRPVKVFQYDFARGSFRWDQTRAAQPHGSFFFEAPQDRANCTEVVLSIELTAELDVSALPPELASGIQDGSVPWLRIRASSPGGRCIGHPDDLDQFTAAAREALMFAQDKLRAHRVHLFGIAPASSLFRYGQLLRPGHHSTHVLYDRPDRNLPFRPALTLTGHEVADAAPLDDGRTTIKLR
jgi:hypothetical protein